MYDKLNITENHLRTISLFTKGFDTEYYERNFNTGLKPKGRNL